MADTEEFAAPEILPVVIYEASGQPPSIRATDPCFTLADALRILNMRFPPGFRGAWVGLQDLKTNEVILGAGYPLFGGRYKTLRYHDVFRIAAAGK